MTKKVMRELMFNIDSFYSRTKKLISGIVICSFTVDGHQNQEISGSYEKKKKVLRLRPIISQKPSQKGKMMNLIFLLVSW